MIPRIGVLLLFIASLMLSSADKPAANPAEAARLNNLGLAYMNQQVFDKGLREFQEAAALDPALKVARLNQGIALLNLGKVEAARPILEDAVRNDARDPHAWYNLGLLDKNSDNPQQAVDAFRRVTEIDPGDADAWYFLGAAYSQAKQFPQAIDAFEHALKLNPLHASAQFGISRAYQQSGDTAHAREHLVRFQYITQNKLGAPISLAYGEQGKYSLVEESPAGPPKVLPQIDMKFVNVTTTAGLALKPQPTKTNDLGFFLGPGACFLDYDADGQPDLFLADSGREGGLSLWRNLGGGK